MRTETVDIIRDLVENIGLKLKIKSVTDNEDGTYNIDVCNTIYLSGKYENQNNAFTIEIDSVVYEVISVENDIVTLKGDTIPTVGTKSIQAPYFFHGTILQTNSELSQISDVFQKTPMVYLRRTFTENWNRFNTIERTADITLYFLTQANFEHWQTENFDKFAIQPMRKLCYEFIDKLLNNKQIGRFEVYTITDAIKFATFVNDKGYESQKFNDTLSGVQLDISIPIRKNYICNC